MKLLATLLLIIGLTVQSYGQLPPAAAYSYLNGGVYVVYSEPCQANAVGTITVTPPTIGTPPFQYKLNAGAYQNSNVFTNLSPGNYVITIKDNAGDTIIANAAVPQAPDTLSVLAIVTPASSSNTNDGCIHPYVAGGIPPYFYQWSTGQSTATTCGDPPGIYCLTVTDASGCQSTQCDTIGIGVTPFQAWTVSTDVNCPNATNGTITVTPIGGNPPYQYKLGNGSYQGSNVFTGLGPGVYTITIKDQSNQTVQTGAAINHPAPIVVDAAVVNATTSATIDGSIQTLISGGAPPYTYFWSGGVISPNRVNLFHGNYSITVTDSLGCSATATFTVGAGATLLSAIAGVTNPGCNGNNDGAINLIAYGGNPPYTYLWNNGETSHGIDSLGAGEYIFTITDAANHQIIDSIAITEPGYMYTSGYVANVSCHGFGDGIVDLTPYGGTPPYSYKWSNGDSTQDLFHLNGGNYFVTVTDAHGCQETSLFLIDNPPLLEVSGLPTSTTCAGNADGSIISIVAGGSHPFSYHWSNNSTQPNLTGVGPGNYNVVVTDSNGCSATATFTIGAGSLTYRDDSATICSPRSYNFYGFILTSYGNYTDTVIGNSGCDTLVTLYLYTLPFSEQTFSVLLTPGAQYTFQGQIYSTPGIYSDTLISSNGCDSILTLYLSFTTVVNEVPSPVVTIYPNPANNKVHLITDIAGSYAWKLFNLLGELLLRGPADKPAFDIDISSLASGTYFIRLNSALGETQGRVVKE